MKNINKKCIKMQFPNDSITKKEANKMEVEKSGDGSCSGLLDCSNHQYTTVAWSNLVLPQRWPIKNSLNCNLVASLSIKICQHQLLTVYCCENYILAKTLCEISGVMYVSVCVLWLLKNKKYIKRKGKV